MQVGRLHGTVSTRCQAKPLQRLAVDLQHDRIGALDEAEALCGFEVRAIGLLEIALFRRKLVFPEALVLNVFFKLSRIGLASALASSVAAAPPRQRANPRPPLMTGKIIRVVAIERGS